MFNMPVGLRWKLNTLVEKIFYCRTAQVRVFSNVLQSRSFCFCSDIWVGWYIQSVKLTNLDHLWCRYFNFGSLRELHFLSAVSYYIYPPPILGFTYCNPNLWTSRIATEAYRQLIRTNTDNKQKRKRSRFLNTELNLSSAINMDENVQNCNPDNTGMDFVTAEDTFLTLENLKGAEPE